MCVAPIDAIRASRQGRRLGANWFDHLLSEQLGLDRLFHDFAWTSTTHWRLGGHGGILVYLDLFCNCQAISSERYKGWVLLWKLVGNRSYPHGEYQSGCTWL